jgi:hypothetical protein
MRKLDIPFYRGFEIIILPATNTKPARVKIRASRYASIFSDYQKVINKIIDDDDSLWFIKSAVNQIIVDHNDPQIVCVVKVKNGWVIITKYMDWGEQCNVTGWGFLEDTYAKMEDKKWKY